MVKIIFVAAIIGIVGLAISYGYWIPRMPDIKPIAVYNPSYHASELPISSNEATKPAVVEPASIIIETDLENRWKLIELEKPKLSFKIPESWTYSFDYFNELEFNGKKYHSISGILNNGSGKGLSINVNFQGGWCEGGGKIEPVRLADKFGLPARSFDCDPERPEIIYLYGDRDALGTVIPNLFVSISDGEDEEIKEVFNSINYSPEQSGNLKFKVINYTND